MTMVADCTTNPTRQKIEEDDSDAGPYNNMDNSDDGESDDGSLSYSKSDWSNHTANGTR